MKVTPKLWLVVAVVSLLCCLGEAKLRDDHTWEEFKEHFSKKHADPTEEKKRHDNWKANMKFIKEHNAKHARGEVSYQLAANHLADLSDEESQARKTLRPPQPRGGSTEISVSVRPPEDIGNATRRQARISTTCTVATAVNLTRSICMPPVKNQGGCASCWAFSGLTSLEWQACKVSRTTTVLSEQQLVDCSASYGTYQCGGGWYDQAWQYIQEAGGVTTADNYPYTGQNGECFFDPATAVISVSNFGFIDPKDFTSMRCYLQTHAPLSAAINAVSGFDYYSSGIYADSRCSSALSAVNHGIGIVGFGTLNGVKYWIIRNSEGPSWGMNGYMLIKAEVNMCGIENWVAVVFK